MKNLTDEIKLTIELMQGDIDDGAHEELQSHLYSLLEMKRNEIQQMLVERNLHSLRTAIDEATNYGEKKMKTNLIEITVSGRTGCGKSEVLEVIRNAIDDFYCDKSSTRVRIAGKNPKGAIDEAIHTRQTAKGKNTVFVLYEQSMGAD